MGKHMGTLTPPVWEVVLNPAFASEHSRPCQFWGALAAGLGSVCWLTYLSHQDPHH